MPQWDVQDEIEAAPAAELVRDFHVHNVHAFPGVRLAHEDTASNRPLRYSQVSHGAECDGQVAIIVRGFPGPKLIRMYPPSGRERTIPIQDGRDRGVRTNVNELGSWKAELCDPDGAVLWTSYWMVGEGLDDLYRPEHPRGHAHPDDYSRDARTIPVHHPVTGEEVGQVPAPRADLTGHQGA
jgi:hypothetical protein